MSGAYSIFVWVSAAAGAVGLIALAGLCLGAAVVQAYKMAKVWHVICLALSVRLHGKDYADRQFWWAIKERASRSNSSARIIADYALKHSPQARAPNTEPQP